MAPALSTLGEHVYRVALICQRREKFTRRRHHQGREGGKGKQLSRRLRLQQQASLRMTWEEFGRREPLRGRFAGA